VSEDKIKNLEIWCKHQFQIDLSKQQIQQFQKYLSLLQEWNQKINLTAIKKENEIIEKHFIDSVTCLTIPVFWLNIRVMDIGTGAGFPGIPLKIIRPDLELALVETVGKKAQFLEKVIHELKLENVKVLKERAEVLGHQPEHRESYDVVISRALAKLSVASELCLPFVKPYRVYLVMLGEDITEQLDSAKFAIPELGGKVQFVNKISDTHSIAVIEKKKNTLPKYPRKAGIPEKRPLIKK
jgi:16S rRNA (guanine527-N7)-methyltransferase